MTYPKVSIIVLNWNGLEDTIECLESLRKITYPNYKVIVVDNASEEHDVNILREKFRDFVQIIENDKNYGFSEGNNIGMRYVLGRSRPDYILVLNNDTIVTPEFLGELIRISESDRHIGAAQPLILRPGGEIVDSLGQELLSCGARDGGIHTERRMHTFDKPSEIFGPCAAAALYKGKALEETGLFDRDFFIIFEDVDLSWRLRLNGYKTVFIPDSIVYHKRGISGKAVSNSRKLTLIRRYNLSKNWLLIAIRYYPLNIVLKVFIKYIALCSTSVYYSVKLRKFDELLICVKKSWVLRKINRTNALLPQIQKQWIKN